MKNKNNYLSKKRKKVFEIEKITHKTKVFPNYSKKYFKIIKDKNNILNNNNTNTNSYPKNNNNKLKENQKQSLTEIAKLVEDYIKKKKVTTGNQATEYTKKVLQLENCDELTQKNIQRRVYDAINVMSFKRIKKNKQRLEYIYYSSDKKDNIKKKENIEINENKNDNDNENNNLNNIEEEDEDEDEDNYKNEDEDEIEEEYKNKLKILKKLQKILIKKYILIKFQEKFEKMLEEPKKLINDMLKNIDIINKESKNAFNDYIFNSNSKRLNRYDLMKIVVAPEILAKLNNNNDNNYCQSDKDKENELSIMNGGYIIDNINIDSKKRNTNKSKEEEDKIFNYLKNLKLFRDELLFNSNNKSL